MYMELLILLWPKCWCFVCLRIYELQQALSEANRRRDEGMHTMDIILREKDHANQADKLNLTSKVADTVEDVNKRLLSKEIKMREEMQERYLQLERVSFKSSFFLKMPYINWAFLYFCGNLNSSQLRHWCLHLSSIYGNFKSTWDQLQSPVLCANILK